VRPKHEVEQAKALFDEGLNDCEIARAIALPRSTVREWRIKGWSVGHYIHNGIAYALCPRCSDGDLAESQYAYLLGLYLGDGCLSPAPRGVYRLRITLDHAYPMIIAAASEAIAAVRGGGPDCVGFAQQPGCIEVYGYWKHWPCLFPQHGAGRKHLRKIELAPWQHSIAERFSRELLRGLIHSDGCRDLNVVNGKSYPRYSFINHSADIRMIFCDACDRLGVHWTRPYWQTVSLSRRTDVEFLDTFIGPKT